MVRQVRDNRPGDTRTGRVRTHENHTLSEGAAMSKLRRPRDIENYISASQAAIDLRLLADRMEAGKKTRPLIKVEIKISCWNEKWREGGGDE